MNRFAELAHAHAGGREHEDAYGYRTQPQDGLNWSFFRALAPSVAVWTSIGLSATFWLAVLVAIAR